MLGEAAGTAGGAEYQYIPEQSGPEVPGPVPHNHQAACQRADQVKEQRKGKKGRKGVKGVKGERKEKGKYENLIERDEEGTGKGAINGQLKVVMILWTINTILEL